MANGKPKIDFDALQRMLQGETFVGPVILDDDTRERAEVVDASDPNTAQKIGSWLGKSVSEVVNRLGPFGDKSAITDVREFTTEQAPRALWDALRGAKTGFEEDRVIRGTPSSADRRSGRTQNESRGETPLQSLNRLPSDITQMSRQLAGNRMQEEGGGTQTQTGQSEDPVTRALRGDEANIERRSDIPSMMEMLTNQDFEGARVEGTTPRGFPEAEEVSGFGKVVRDFGKALETPGFQKFLAQMGMAFSGGNPNEPGTILGQGAIETVEAGAEAELMRKLQEGEEITREDMIELGATSENLRAATEATQASRQLDQGERGLDIEERATEADISQQEQRLQQLGEELGFRADQIDINRFDAITRRMQAAGALQNAQAEVENLQSFELGMAADFVSSEFVDQAMENLRAGSGIESVAEIQEALQGPEGEIDPSKVRANLNDQQRQIFDSMVPRIANSIARSGQDIGQEGGFDIPTSARQFIEAGGTEITRIRTQAQRDALEDGALYEDAEGRVFMKQQGQDIPIF